MTLPPWSRTVTPYWPEVHGIKPLGDIDAESQSDPPSWVVFVPAMSMAYRGPPYQAFCELTCPGSIATGPAAFQPAGKVGFQPLTRSSGSFTDSTWTKVFVCPPAGALAKSKVHDPTSVGQDVPETGGPRAGSV